MGDYSMVVRKFDMDRMIVGCCFVRFEWVIGWLLWEQISIGYWLTEVGRGCIVTGKQIGRAHV